MIKHPSKILLNFHEQLQSTWRYCHGIKMRRQIPLADRTSRNVWLHWAGILPLYPRGIWGKVVIYRLGIRNCFLNYMFHSFERYLQAVKIRQQTSKTFVQSSLCSTVFGQLYPNRYADVFFKNFCNSIKYVTWKTKTKSWFLLKNDFWWKMQRLPKTHMDVSQRV